MLDTAKLLERLPTSTAEREPVLEQLRALLSALRAVGVLDMFTPRSPAIALLLDEADGAPA
ncbi:MAG: hypothetical protein L0H59_06810 [Tomitella sp.]|nr:hypothetical protein [Tomitella sp.]